MGNEDMAKMMEVNQTRGLNSLEARNVFMIVENERGEILLQKRSNTEDWQLPGGVKASNEAYKETALRAISEEPGLHLAQLTSYRMFSREDFTSYYAAGDEIFSDMAIYMAKSYFGYLKSRAAGSVKLSFFSLYDLPPDFQVASKLIVDAYAADHFWIGG
jgi:ADP-ribose pyrophosphatase YjhB (NUDIX family)